MDLSLFTLVLAAAAFVLLGYASLRARRPAANRRLDHLPQVTGGHWLLGFFPWMSSMTVLFTAVAKAGPVRALRMMHSIGNEFVVVSDPELIRKVFVHSSQRMPTDIPRALHKLSLFNIDPEDLWRPRRRRMNQAFTSASVAAMFTKVNASAKATVAYINSTKVPKDAHVDIQPIVTRAVMDSLVRCVFSREYDEVLDRQRIDASTKVSRAFVADALSSVPIVRWWNPFKAIYVSVIRQRKKENVSVNLLKKNFLFLKY